MSKVARVALIALGAILLLPGACSALALPFMIGIIPSLFGDSTQAKGYAFAGLSIWTLGAALGLAGFWLLRRLWLR